MYPNWTQTQRNLLLTAALVALLAFPAQAQEEDSQAEMCTTKTATLTQTQGGYQTTGGYVEAFQTQATLTVTNPCDGEWLLVEVANVEEGFQFSCSGLEIHQPLVPDDRDRDGWGHHRYVYRGHGYAGKAHDHDENGYVSLHYPGNQGGACHYHHGEIDNEGRRRFWISFDPERVDNSRRFLPLEPFQIVFGVHGDDAVVLTFP